MTGHPDSLAAAAEALLDALDDWQSRDTTRPVVAKHSRAALRAALAHEQQSEWGEPCANCGELLSEHTHDEAVYCATLTERGGQPDPDDELPRTDGVLPEALYIDIESEIHMHMNHDGQSDEANDWVTDMMSAISPHIVRGMLKAHARGVFQGLAEARSTPHGEVLFEGVITDAIHDPPEADDATVWVKAGPNYFADMLDQRVIVVRASADQGETDGE